MKVQFIGATMEVTGSCTLLEVGGKYYLVDCGMEQGIDVFQNVSLPVSARDIEAVFLTHAHIDHSGMLPKLYKDGFRGTIYSTGATAKLCSIMLRDSAHIQMTEAEWRSRKAERSGEPKFEPTYTMDDALGAIECFKSCPYGQKEVVANGVEVRFTDVGHLLGSACVELWLSEGEEKRKIVFSGDVGNLNQPIINDPKTVEETDYLVLESTYGNRLHNAPVDTIETFAEYLEKTLSRGGNVVIPSFAVGRTQELLYAIREIKERGLVKNKKFPVYVDSPLAIEATNIFAHCDKENLDSQTLALIERGINPIKFEGLKLAVSVEDSKFINVDNTPKVIISASGMCEAGRIRHHLKHNLYNSQNLILFVGYQANASLGRALLEGVKSVKLFGEQIAVRAEIRSLKGLSGHADKDGLISWLKAFKSKPKTVFLNHGDEQSILDFTNDLKDMGYAVETPCSGAEYDLKSGIMTISTECVRIEKAKERQNRKDSVQRNLVGSAESLLSLTKRLSGLNNKDKAKLTSQINAIINKWNK